MYLFMKRAPGVGATYSSMWLRDLQEHTACDVVAWYVQVGMRDRATGERHGDAGVQLFLRGGCEQLTQWHTLRRYKRETNRCKKKLKIEFEKKRDRQRDLGTFLRFTDDVQQNTLLCFDAQTKYDLTGGCFMSHDVTCDKNPKHMYTFNTQLSP